MTPQDPSPALFLTRSRPFQRTEALRTAIELDLFTAVAAGPRTANQIAAACQASPRGIRILADYLTVLGFLRKQDDQYEVTLDSPCLPQPPVAGVPGRSNGVSPGGRAAPMLSATDTRGASRRDCHLRGRDGNPTTIPSGSHSPAPWLR